MKLRLGSRRSTLSLVQAELVLAALKRLAPNLEVEIVEIRTLGDKKQGTPEASRSEKRDWIHELEVAVEEGAVDMAVHSGKDVPAVYSQITEILPVLPRGRAFDVFIGRRIQAGGGRLKFKDIPEEGLVGCASLRRRAQLLRIRPDLRFVEHRGNVTTRLENLERIKSLSGIVLAQAGLDRLGLSGVDGDPLAPEQLVPAINQGMLVAQFATRRGDIKELVQRLIDQETLVCFQAERACVTALNADCHSSVGVYAVSRGRHVHITARVLSIDGRECVEVSREGLAQNSSEVGRAAATELLNRGAARLILQARRECAGRAR